MDANVIQKVREYLSTQPVMKAWVFGSVLQALSITLMKKLTFRLSDIFVFSMNWRIYLAERWILWKKVHYCHSL